jgi:hypothetical protein
MKDGVAREVLCSVKKVFEVIVVGHFVTFLSHPSFSQLLYGTSLSQYNQKSID